MTQPQDSPQVFDGIDIEVAPEEVEVNDDEAATSDTDEMSGGGEFGGAGGEGGAG